MDAVTERDPSPSAWPAPSRRHEAVPRIQTSRPDDQEPASPGNVLAELIGRMVSELRRRIGLIALTFALVLAPVIAYSVFAVPTYAARGTVQASSSNGAMNP